MAQFERFPEINESLRKFFLDYDDIKDITGDNVFYPRPGMQGGRQASPPLAFFRRAGGPLGYYRYMLTIRSNNTQTMEALAKAFVRRLHSKADLVTNENIVDISIEGQWNDSGDESVGWHERSLYFLVEILEAQYS